MSNRRGSDSDSDNALFSDVSDVESTTDHSDDDAGEDLTDALMLRADQRRDDRLDQYDQTLLGDDTDSEEFGYHQAMTRQLDERDDRIKKTRQRGSFFLGGRGEEGDPLLQSQDDLHYLVEPNMDDLPLEELHVPPDQLLAQPRAAETIKKRFLKLLLDYQQDGNWVYENAIDTMAEENKSSFYVDFQHLVATEPVLARLLLEVPKEMLALFEDEGNRLINLRYPNYSLIFEHCNVRFINVGNAVNLVDIRHDHMNHFISVHGVVVRRSNVYPKLQTAVYQCVRCNATLPGIQQSLIGSSQIPHLRCPQADCQSKTLRLNQTNSIFQNFQKLTIQEAPGSVQAGRIPRQVDVVVFDDLIDACTPGEEIEVIGHLQLIPDTHMNRQTGFPIYSTTLVANNVLKQRSNAFSSNDALTEAEIRLIESLSRDEKIQDLIINSIAPSIYGHYDIKTAIACSLFAGCPKHLASGARLRGDINVLLVGDPGVAKSQFLKYTEKIGHRAIYTTGKGASAVGLTATVQRDKFTGEWTLEGGALVLADQGTCLIDEFDKMSDQDRTSIHEAMEQQTISISKAGIVCTLTARCGVIAAANPIGGNYNDQLTFQEQVDLTEPILSRFDILCVVRDKIDLENDKRLARFITGAHVATNTLSDDTHRNPNNEDDVTVEQMRARGYLSQKLLSKYIRYARANFTPSLKPVNNDKIVSLYIKLRRAAQSSHGIQITPRHLESLLRISEALAKMRLAHAVNDDDVNSAIHIVLDSFFQSQKTSVRQEFERQFSSYLFQLYDKHTLILDVIKEMVNNTIAHRQVIGFTYEEAVATEIKIKTSHIAARASEKYGSIDLPGFFDSDVFLNARGYTLNTESNTLLVRLQD